MADKITDYAVNSARWLSLEDFEGEIWKDIPDFEGLYQVSNMGRVKSLDRHVVYKRPQDNADRHRFFPSTILKASTYGNYLICHVGVNRKVKAIKYHRLVCSVFNPNPNKLPEVNHLNEIKTDNRAENLEWCTRLRNARWGTAIQRKAIALTNRTDISKVVFQFSLDGVYIAKYPSATEAERQTGVKTTNILSACYDKRNSSAGGYLWSFTQDPTTILRKISRREKGLKHYGCKPVQQLSMNGTLIKDFPSIEEAARQTGISKDTISRCCKHQGYYKSAGGYKWEYK